MPTHIPLTFRSAHDPALATRIEQKLAHTERISPRQAILTLAAVGGTLSLAVLMPGLTKLLPYAFPDPRRNYRSLWRQFQALRKQRAIIAVKTAKGTAYEITPLGKKMIERFLTRSIAVPKPKRWDGSWWLVLFDIPEKHGRNRRAFSFHLRDMGFYQCQRSVWIHPFPCIAEVETLKQLLGIGSYVQLFRVSEMTDGKVLHHFQHLLADMR